jgi:hypothetical protein
MSKNVTMDIEPEMFLQKNYMRLKFKRALCCEVGSAITVHEDALYIFNFYRTP